MKIRNLFITILLSALLCVSAFSANAAGSLLINIRSETTGRNGGNLDVCVVFSYDQGIGAFKVSVPYDVSVLTFKTAELEEKSRNDLFRYTDTNGQVRFVYSDSEEHHTERTVRLHFSVNDPDTLDTSFELSSCEVCDKNSKPIYADKLPRCRVRYSTGNSIEVSSEMTEQSSSEKSKVSVNTSNQEMEPEVTDKETSSGKSSKSGSSAVEYIIHDNSSKNSYNELYILIGGLLLICSAAIVLAFKAGMKRAGKNGDEKQKTDKKQ